MSTKLKKLVIGDKCAEIPVIQGGMGVGISRSSLAGAVAKEGGIGVISTAQIGYDEEGFENNQAECNRKAIGKHIRRAKEISEGKGLVGVNIMAALKHYKEHVDASVEAGADVIISGAGLPVNLPAVACQSAERYGVEIPKLAPIVSSGRAAEIILKMWDHKYKTAPDFMVAEGPLAGGHLGFSPEQLEDIKTIDFDGIIRDIVEVKKPYEEKYQRAIPLVVGGGVFDRKDIDHVFSLGADGVQIASRFVATEECDASDAYKQAYINAGEEDIQIVKSPVGMPGRALCNAFIKKVENEKEKITKCYNCLEKCNPANVPYCITKALTNAVMGDIDNGLIFVGANVGKINKMTTVHELMQEFQGN